MVFSAFSAHLSARASYIHNFVTLQTTVIHSPIVTTIARTVIAGTRAADRQRGSCCRGAMRQDLIDGCIHMVQLQKFNRARRVSLCLHASALSFFLEMSLFGTLTRTTPLQVTREIFKFQNKF